MRKQTFIDTCASYISEVASNRAGRSLREIRGELAIRGVEVSISTIGNALHIFGGRRQSRATVSTRPESERFWEKVDVRSADDCWIWMPRLRKDGYGQFRYRGKPIGAHKAAWQIANGSQLERHACVCHRCDMPACVNPNHLFVSDHRGNTADKVMKGRQSRGESAAKKLTALDVVEIRRSIRSGTAQSVIAATFSINQSNVSRIGSGKRWRVID